jgi:hypothetical protein
MKLLKPSCHAPRAVNARRVSAGNSFRRGTVLCIDGDPDFFDALFTFSTFLLVFAIGLGFGLFVKGP